MKKIDRTLFDGLNRQEIRLLVNSMLESDSFKNADPAIRDYPRSIEGTGRDTGRSFCGIVEPLNYWKSMLHTLEFEQGGSSTANWMEYTIRGLKAEGVSEYAYGMLTFIYDDSHYDYDNDEYKVSHQITINYRDQIGKFHSYTGNTEDFFLQVLEYAKVIAKRKKLRETGNKFGLSERSTSFPELIASMYDEMEDNHPTNIADILEKIILPTL